MIRPALWLTVWLAGCGLIDPLPQTQDVWDVSSLAGSPYASFQLLPQLPRASGERLATKLTYLATDESNHQSDWSLKKLQMLDDLPQQRVHNVVFRDGEEVGDSRLYYLTGGDGNPGTLGSPESLLAPSVREVQSNNPHLFSRILAWTLDHYPGKRKYLEIYTHGLGAFGLATDERQTDLQGEFLPDKAQIKVMPVADFGEALRQGLRGRRLDLIYFRACLMGNLEALYELRGTTRYAVASEDVSLSVDNSNLTMTQLFDTLASQGVEPAEIARALAIQGHANRARLATGELSGYQTLAAVDIDRLTDLKTAVHQLAQALLNAMSKHRAAIVAAYDSVPTIHGNRIALDDADHLRDLWTFCTLLMRQVPDPSVQRAVAAVRETHEKALLHTRDAYGANAHGLSIFMPARASRGQLWVYLQNQYAATRLAQETRWDEFLWTLFGLDDT